MIDDGWPRKEFIALLKQYWLLFMSLEERTVLSAVQLIKARNQIENCDHLTENRTRRAHLLYITFNYWKECLENWNLETPLGEEGVKIPSLELKTGRTNRTTQEESDPETRFSEAVSKNKDDLRFLRSLRIKNPNPPE